MYSPLQDPSSKDVEVATETKVTIMLESNFKDKASQCLHVVNMEYKHS